VTPAHPPRIVDSHLHFIPPSLVSAIEAATFPGVDLARGGSELVFRFPDMPPSPPAQAALCDLPRLLAWGAEEGIDLHLVGPWTDLLGYTLSEPEATSWTRAYNEVLAATCEDHANLVPVATVPMQHPELAVREVEVARGMGCRGVMIGSDIPGLGFDSPRLGVFWEAAEALEMPVILHPTLLAPPPRLLHRGLKNAVGRAGEIVLALTQLVYSGALVRHPRLAVVGALGGGGFVVLAERITRNHELGWSETEGDVAVSIDRLYFDTCLGSSAYLGFLVDQIGADRVLLGSDYPFPWQPHPVAKVAEAGLAPGLEAAVLGGNARRLFGLDS
jgi:aminocarboxymuconate-semialdehyde decarboxylase